MLQTATALLMLFVLAEPVPRPLKPQPMGPWPLKTKGLLEKKMVQRYVRQHLPAVRHCYEQELGVQPTLQIAVAVRFTIAPTGRVARAESGASALEQCVSQAVRQIQFPPVFHTLADGSQVLGDPTTVSYRFRFRPARRVNPPARLSGSWELPDRLHEIPAHGGRTSPAPPGTPSPGGSTPAPAANQPPPQPGPGTVPLAPTDPDKLVPVPTGPDTDPLKGLDLSAP